MLDLQALEQELIEVLNQETKESLLDWYAEQDRKNAHLLTDSNNGALETLHDFVVSQEFFVVQSTSTALDIVASNTLYANNSYQENLYPIAA